MVQFCSRLQATPPLRQKIILFWDHSYSKSGACFCHHFAYNTLQEHFFTFISRSDEHSFGKPHCPTNHQSILHVPYSCYYRTLRFFTNPNGRLWLRREYLVQHCDLTICLRACNFVIWTVLNRNKKMLINILAEIRERLIYSSYY